MESIDKEFIEYFNIESRAFGGGNMPGTVIAILYIEPEPVAMEDLAKRTGYSLASISHMMKMLETTGFVRRIKKPKTRKVYFYMEKDMLKHNKQKLVMVYENSVKPAMELLPPILEKYKNKSRDERARRKYEIVRDYYSQMVEFEKIIKHMIEDIDLISAGKSGKAMRAYKP